MGFMTSPASESLKEILRRLDQKIQAVDEERWLSSRYATADQRAALIILYAFYYELARVRLVVTDATLGNIRFQWWRDALAELEQGQVREHDVCLALEAVLTDGVYKASDLLELVDAHETAFMADDRAEEPEGRLAEIAARGLNDAPMPFDQIKAIASAWSALRRGETPPEARARSKIPSASRPALAHFRLRHIWRRRGTAGRLQSRLSVLMAMLTGRI